MRIAIIERVSSYNKEDPTKVRYTLPGKFREIFDELNILLIPVISENNLDQIVDMCDGLILPGGGNHINPKYYGEEANPEVNYIHDEYPLVSKIVRLFVDANKPILGICAGIQEINVIYGGTLHQKIDNHSKEDGSTHIVKLNRDSFLYDVYGKDIIETNTYHIQAIKDVAEGFKVTAVSEDGIIEGIEKDNIIGVQFHPEVVKDMDFFNGLIDKVYRKR